MKQSQRDRLEVLRDQPVRNPVEEKEFQALTAQAENEDRDDESDDE